MDLRFKNQVIVRMKDDETGEKIIWGVQEKIIVGLDIGSTKVCTLIAAVRENGLEPIGVGVAESEGVKERGDRQYRSDGRVDQEERQ